MNELTKEKIAAKVILAIETEKMMNVEAAKCLGINSVYLSMIKKHEQYGKCPEVAWEKMRQWYHSGKPLREYKPEIPAEVPAPDVTPQPHAEKPEDGVVHHRKTVFIPAEEINKRLEEIRKEKPTPKVKKNPPKSIKPPKVTKPPVKTGDELIADVISHIGFEIDVIVKLKRS